MIRRAFVRALSGAILTTLLGLKPWRLEDAEWEEWVRISDLGQVRPLIDPGPHEMHATIVYDTISFDGKTVERHTHEIRLPPPGPMQFENFDGIGILARREPRP